MKRLNYLCLVCSLSVGSAARADSAVAWGNYPGDGSTQSHEFVAVSGMDSGVTAVAAGGHHSLALQNGGAYAWGSNTSGQLGDGTSTDRLTPVPVIGMGSGVTAVAAGGFGNSSGHSLAVQNGGLFAWGSRFAGQLGDGTFGGFRSTPAPVIGMDSGVTAVAAGDQHSLAIQNGALFAWGSNGSGQIGNGTLPTGPLDVNFRFLTPAPVIGLSSGVTAISAGSFHSLAVKDGGVYSWGSNRSATPQLVAGLETGATAVATGDVYSLAVVNSGVYRLFNYGTAAVQVDPTNLINIVAVAADGCCDAYALSSNGSLWSWNNESISTPQQLLPPAGYKFTSIAAGFNHAVATLGAVPEPNTLLLLCFGSLAVLWRKRTRNG